MIAIIIDDSLRPIIERDIAVLMFIEVVLPSVARYRYHYSDVDGKLIFGYDTVPHHPELKTFPHHKHVPSGILDSSEKRSGQVMAEIVDQFVADE